MVKWLASEKFDTPIEQADHLPIPQTWLQDRPNLRKLFAFDDGFVYSLHETFARQEDGTFCHILQAVFQPANLPTSQNEIDAFVEHFKSQVRDLLEGSEIAEQDALDEGTRPL